MYMKAFSVHDTKADLWNSPFFMRTEAEAVRSFGAIAQDLKTAIGQHPRDFVLYLVGDFDDSTGVIRACDEPELLAVAADMLSPDENQLDMEGLQ